MTIEAAITDAVATALAPLVAEIRALRASIEALRAASPSRLVTVGELVRLGYGSPATIRRRIADGSIPAIRRGRSVRIDISALQPLDPAAAAALADAARRA